MIQYKCSLKMPTLFLPSLLDPKFISTFFYTLKPNQTKLLPSYIKHMFKTLLLKKQAEINFNYTNLQMNTPKVSEQLKAGNKAPYLSSIHFVLCNFLSPSKPYTVLSNSSFRKNNKQNLNHQFSFLYTVPHSYFLQKSHNPSKKIIVCQGF